MWYLISGQLMTLSIYLLFYKLFKNFYDLILIEKFMGWFLIDHILEEYSITAGKFFLINEDYRSLIKNLTILIKNICFLAQFFTPIQFILVNICLIFLYFLIKDIIKTYKARFLIFMCYFVLLQAFLIINFNFLFKFINLVLNILLFFFIIGVYFYLIGLSLIYRCSYHTTKKKLILKIIKFFLVLVVCLFLFFLILIEFWVFSFDKDNIILEFVIKFLVSYVYFYSFV